MGIGSIKGSTEETAKPEAGEAGGDGGGEDEEDRAVERVFALELEAVPVVRQEGDEDEPERNEGGDHVAAAGDDERVRVFVERIPEEIARDAEDHRREQNERTAEREDALARVLGARDDECETDDQS